MTTELSSFASDALSPSAEDLLGRVTREDHTAFVVLYRQVSGRTFGVVKHVLKDPAQSEEVTQEVFLEIWQTANRFDRKKGRALTWILTIAQRRAIDRVRSAQSSKNREWTVGLRNLDVEYDSVAEHAEISIEHARVERALLNLTALQREAIELAFASGHTQTEVASLLRVPLGTVKTRLRDGLGRLRRDLDPTV